MPEVWLRGAVPGIPAELMPVAHSLLQIREELEAIVPLVPREQLWVRPGGAASIGFHLKHLAGSLDRLLTYARGEALTERQIAFLNAEETDGPEAPDHLLRSAIAAIDEGLKQVRSTDINTLRQPRRVGRAGLPSTVLGLLFHAAEHAQRHSGQIATTTKVVTSFRRP